MARIAKLGAKLGLVGGAIYGTSELGIWKDSTVSEEIYKELYSYVSKYVKDVPVEIPELPRVMDISASSKEMWNHGVVNVATFLINLPDNLTSLAKKGVDMAVSLYNSESSKPPAQ